MSPEQQRKSNTVLGGVFLGTGAVAWILALFFAVVPNPPVPTPVSGASKVDLSSCRAALTELGYTATLEGPRIRLFEPLTASPKEQLEKASIAATVCKLQMKEFCMGTTCQNPGLSMILIEKPSSYGSENGAPDGRSASSGASAP